MDTTTRSFFDGCAFGVVVGMALALGAVSLCTGCAHTGRRGPADESQALKPLCHAPAVVRYSQEEPPTFVLAVKRAVAAWNQAAGRPILVSTAVPAEEVPDPVLADTLLDMAAIVTDRAKHGHEITIQHSPRPEADDPDHGERVWYQFDEDGSCLQYADIVVYMDPETHARTIEYAAKHGLGHALGLPHGWFGVMREEMPARLWDYVSTGGYVDVDDRLWLRKTYGGAL